MKVEIHTNCDCGSGKIISYKKNWKYGPRCPYCNKILGPMEYRILELKKPSVRK
jgi:hypothetical protein